MTRFVGFPVPSECDLRIYTRQHSFENKPKTQQIQTASGLDEDGIDWHDPGNGTWHNKHPETACRLCENKPDFQQVPLVRPFILQHGPCNQLIRLESNQCTEATRGEVLHRLSLMKWKFWSHQWNSRQLFTSICILQISVNMFQLSHIED